MATLLVLNGPNLNLLGTREPQYYGAATLKEIEANIVQVARQHGHDAMCFQSNAEHELIDQIHLAPSHGIGFIIINPGAFTHTSVALRDALSGVAIPFIELHISNVYAREPFRKHSYFSDIAVGVISGLGVKGYELALYAAMDKLTDKH
jgi:3-dehydroquinate dehydratase-2